MIGSALEDPCGKKTVNVGEWITSPNHPDNYDSLTSCDWTLNPVPGITKYVLVFTAFDIEEMTPCNFDSLNVYEQHERVKTMR